MECEEGRQLINVARNSVRAERTPSGYSAFLRNEQTVMPPDLRRPNL